VRNVSVDSDEYTTKMTKLRATIDVLDANLLELLGKRMKVADEIGQVKKLTLLYYKTSVGMKF
jgi:chorismate mutase